MNKRGVLLIVLLISTVISLCSETHLFQNFYRDALIEDGLFGEGHFQYAQTKFEAGPFEVKWSTINVGAIAGYPVTPDLEIDAGIDFISISPDEGDSESGISDITVGGKYLILKKEQEIAIGGLVTLPVGSEDVGQGNLNFGFFGAGRMNIKDNMIITGTIGLDFYEMEKYNINTGKTDTEYETAFVLGAGTIIGLNPDLDLVPEFMMITEIDYMMLSCGADYKINENSSLRGMFGFGLDDGAPDILLKLSYLMGF